MFIVGKSFFSKILSKTPLKGLFVNVNVNPKTCNNIASTNSAIDMKKNVNIMDPYQYRSSVLVTIYGIG